MNSRSKIIANDEDVIYSASERTWVKSIIELGQGADDIAILVEQYKPVSCCWISLNYKTARELGERLVKQANEVERMYDELDELNKKHAKLYKCIVCGVNAVDADNGYDTCDECSNKA